VQKGKLYKHIYGRDVALMPVHMILIPGKNVYQIKCRWFNIVNPKNVFDMGCPDKV